MPSLPGASRHPPSRRRAAPCASAASRSIWQFTPAQPSFMRGEAVGRVCEHGLDARWLSRVVQAYRFTGVA